MTNIFEILNKADIHTGRILGGFSLLLFIIPTATMLILPKLAGTLGFDTNSSLILSVVVAVTSVLGITFSYAWIAYKQQDQGEEVVSKFFGNKANKND
ncbi:hypothetical protein BEWA_012430 [Theileria equi strain WA]|uniref:Uncharacterized protein n=1 Tax=Theileria equi strain WA TaxID=1537102 RepID=L1LBN7_THEEQ|nr:hypothetical protein BEWA_012430 [Theileria equi strain WA]EKX72684.1 hypothetical protein BEWA_012430 [Theileria equi strain WA]|eukprot:XP_004832136.1 hypothetical protein BEWA_012430 [Theileria equi strain WA]